MAAEIVSSHKYDVFLSFRGLDTRKSFTSHLYKALCREKILAYIDHQLKSGEEISSTLLTTIEKSKLSLVIFSKNYANSRWCLDELVHIMKCKEERSHIVFPVFYGVEPSDVRHQKGTYAEAFLKLEKNPINTAKLQQWRKALTAAANLSGFELKHNESVMESTFVEAIVQEVLINLNNISAEMTSEDSKGLVGIPKRFEIINWLLELGCPDVRAIGIWGMSGIGKTTLAEILYNRFFNHFEGCHFANLREDLSENDLRDMKRQLFSDLLDDKKLDHMHSSFANDRLRQKKVLVVLDNVNERRQLEYLLGDDVSKQRERFGIGSRIILTSRDKKLLMARAHVIYEVEALDFDEALKLLHSKAFGEDSTHFKSKFVEMCSRRIVNYAQGNPLALHVLGSHLRFRSIREWESALVELEEAPNKEIERVLKINYDALDEGNKTIFLDIACFFIGEHRDVVEGILDIESHIGINILVEKSLVCIKDSKLFMHDIIRQMASEIVCRDPKEIGQRSRLCNPHDVYYALKNNKGSALTEGIFLDVSKIHEGLSLTSTAFEDMCNLRILKIHSPHSKMIINIPRGLRYLPRSLRFLVWPNCPLKSLATNFEPHNLVKLDLSSSKIKQLWSGVKNLGNIKDMDLSFCEELIELPDLSKAPKLENISLWCCTSLHQLPNLHATTKHLNLGNSGIETFPSSFDSLENLVILTLVECNRLKILPKLPRNIRTMFLRSCGSLESLPSNIWTLKSLSDLDLGGCSRLKNLPQIPEVLEHMHTIYLSYSGIQELPSLENLVGLRFLGLDWCENLKSVPKGLSTLSHLTTLYLSGLKLGCFPPMLLGFPSLKDLAFGYCNISEIPDWLGSLSSLTDIDIRENNFQSIHPCIRKLHNLKYLNVSRCMNLRHVLELRPSLQHVEASECLSLEMVEKISNVNFNELSRPTNKHRQNEVAFLFINCLKMDQNARDNVLINFVTQVLLITSTESERSSDAFEDFTDVRTCYPGNRIPKWFSNQCKGSAVAIKLPSNWLNDKFFGLATCVALEFDDCSHFAFLEIDTTIQFKENYGTTANGDDEKDVVYDSEVILTHRFTTKKEKVTTTSSDHVFIWYRHNAFKFREMKLDGAVEALFHFSGHLYTLEFKKLDIKVKSCGIRMMYLPEAEEDLYSSIASSSSNGCHIYEEPELSMSNDPQPSGTETNCYDADESPTHRVNKCFDFFGCLPFFSTLTGNI